MSTPPAAAGWTAVSLSAPDFAWRPEKAFAAPEETASMLSCRTVFSKNACPMGWFVFENTIWAHTPAETNATLAFRASGVRFTVGAAQRTNISVTLGGAHRTVELGGALLLAESWPNHPVQFDNLDPGAQHTLYIDLADAPASVVGFAAFELLQLEPATTVTATSSDGRGTDSARVSSNPPSAASSAHSPTIIPGTPTPAGHQAPAGGGRILWKVLPATIGVAAGLLLVVWAIIILLQARYRTARKGWDGAVDLEPYEEKLPAAPLSSGRASEGRAGKLRQLKNMWARRSAAPSAAGSDDPANALAFAAALRKAMRRVGLSVEGLLLPALPRRVSRSSAELEPPPEYDG